MDMDIARRVIYQEQDGLDCCWTCTKSAILEIRENDLYCLPNGECIVSPLGFCNIFERIK
jgi:hypothetical protein